LPFLHKVSEKTLHPESVLVILIIFGIGKPWRSFCGFVFLLTVQNKTGVVLL